MRRSYLGNLNWDNMMKDLDAALGDIPKSAGPVRRDPRLSAWGGTGGVSRWRLPAQRAEGRGRPITAARS